jgi:hypothetical protein
MTQDNPTLFVARDVQLVEQLLAQKEELEGEIQRLREVDRELAADFETARAVFLDQVNTGIARVPFYPDVMLRRLLVRAFAENWLPADRLLAIFRQSLDLTPMRAQASDFSAGPKPRVPFDALANPSLANAQ